MMAPTLTIGLPTFGSLPPDRGWRSLLDLARHAEAAGVDRVIVTDHVVMGKNTHEYAWGKFPVPADSPWLEALTALTAVAAVTERIRLSTGILVAPLRPAALLAKEVATLDALSGGRVDLGVGTGWQREEFDAFGLDFEARGRLLTETMAACRALWSDHEVRFEGSTISLSEIYCEPKPVQDPLPVWFAGTLHPRNIERITRWGNGWIPIMGATVADIRDGVARLHQALADAGRDPDQLHVMAPPVYVRADDGSLDVEATLDSLPELAAAGVDSIRVELRAIDRDGTDPEAALDTFVPAFRAAAAR